MTDPNQPAWTPPPQPSAPPAQTTPTAAPAGPYSGGVGVGPAVASSKSFIATWLLSYLLGFFGADRFYLGKIGTAVIKLITLGGYGIWWLIDLILTLTGKATDAQGLRVRPDGKQGTIAWIVTGALIVLGVVIGPGISRSAPAPSVPPAAAPPAVVEETPSEPSPTPTPTENETETPVLSGDATYFKNQVYSNADDYITDTEDMVTTLDEDGFWRLISNSAELSFNLGQLQSLTPPTNIADRWNEQLEKLATHTDNIVDAVAESKYDNLREYLSNAKESAKKLKSIADDGVTD